MKIAVIGATGMAGSRIAAEAARRGHAVSGFSRSGGSDERSPDGFELFTANATDPKVMSRIAAQHDVIVLATRPAPGTEDDANRLVTTVLDAALNLGRRVVVIGGAGPLQSPDCSGQLVIDDPRFVPQQWRTIAQASLDQFNACTTHPADWTYLSPPALFGPGTRTGSYRRGGNQILIDVNGDSRISAEDLAIAALDEIENPQPGLRHFTVAY
ncbi:NAD(P)H-binding protein [Saxibacter everestensis]|uniref:NAD(P)H-binding protein n=1 Tax=Saxibacter everestensis TaxID=2909229 RepID=A0ABY8QSD4_9MICO|nr:NAD(P)H-binding protein [Brevibacteriaceae bacterium ZFBP1038]